MTRAERVVFVGLARDCAAMLPAVLGNLERMSALFIQSAFLFIENGSKDATRSILERWCRERVDACVLTPDTPEASSRQRTVRLAALRNQLLREVRKHFPKFDLLVVVDCDDVNATPIHDMSAFGHAVEFLLSDDNNSAVFGNTLGAYYDMWALRHPARCPGDIWEAVMDRVLETGVRDEHAMREVYAPRIFALPPNAPPMEVESAFGGLGIYRLSAVLANDAPYLGYRRKDILKEHDVRSVGWQCCEHVAFHAGLRAQGGRLFVLPWLVIGELEEVTIPPAAWRGMTFELEDLLASEVTAKPRDFSGLGRNDPCSCGSGRRYKHCHGGLA